eukprot:1160669-Pelagomonas_calceolata.AAC.9
MMHPSTEASDAQLHPQPPSHSPLTLRAFSPARCLASLANAPVSLNTGIGRNPRLEPDPAGFHTYAGPAGWSPPANPSAPLLPVPCCARGCEVA